MNKWGVGSRGTRCSSARVCGLVCAIWGLCCEPDMWSLEKQGELQVTTSSQCLTFYRNTYCAYFGSYRTLSSCIPLLYLISVLSGGTLRTSWTRKTSRTLDAITASGTHGTFLSLDIYDICEEVIPALMLTATPQTLQKKSCARKYSQGLPFHQRGLVVLGGHCVPSDQWDRRSLQRPSLQESPVTKRKETQRSTFTASCGSWLEKSTSCRTATEKCCNRKCMYKNAFVDGDNLILSFQFALG